MKIALVNPRVESYSSTLPPLGVLYVAAVLEREGFDVRVFDPPPHDDGELSDIVAYGPDIIGLSVLTTYVGRARQLIAYLKQHLPQAYFVAGGIHPTVLPEETIRSLGLDCVVIGEGEITFKELALARAAGTPLSEVDGLCYRSGDELIRTTPRGLIEDISTIPFPARHLIDFERYLFPPGIIRGFWSERSTTIITSRGCPFTCIWCGSQAIFGRKVRRRTVENVIAELKILLLDYHVDSIWFIDDTFTLNREWINRFCDAVLANNLRFRWGCQAHVTTADEDLFVRMKEAGLVQLDFGVESGSDRVLNALKKKSSAEAVRNAFRIARKVGIRTLATFMFGNPGEEWEDVEKTFSLAKSIQPDFASSFFITPFPGTELMQMAQEKGWLQVDIDYFDSGLKKRPMMKINFSEEQLLKIRERFQRQFAFRNYASLLNSPKFVLKAFLLGLRYPRGFLYAMRSFVKTKVVDDFVFSFLIYYADQKQKRKK
jgi:anaerobic magnesium-protoporphyrin IX monomethyl ester cyclase